MSHETDKLIDELRGLPAPEMDAGFEQRALGAALEKAGSPQWLRRFATGLSAAAAVMVAVLVSVQFEPIESPGVPVEVAETAGVPATTRTRPVNLVLTSARAVEGASLTIELDANLALENYPDVRTLSWQTDLKPGHNKLTLPVRQLDGRSGDILVTLNHGDLRRQLSIHINDA